MLEKGTVVFFDEEADDLIDAAKRVIIELNHQNPEGKPIAGYLQRLSHFPGWAVPVDRQGKVHILVMENELPPTDRDQAAVEAAANACWQADRKALHVVAP
jgi:hypothetical protein